MKKCSKCKQEKTLEEFNIQVGRHLGRTSNCKTCKSIYRKSNKKEIKLQQNNWRLKNRDADLSKKKSYYQNNKDKKLVNDLKVKFNLTLDEYNSILDRQNGVCQICKNPETTKDLNGNIKRLAVDHCHKTNKVRGLLCMFCNTGLGKFKDNVEYLESASAYLKKHK